MLDPWEVQGVKGIPISGDAESDIGRKVKL